MAGSFFQRLKDGLTKSRETWVQKIGSIFQNREWDEQSLDEMEESLLTADVGVKATQKLMDTLRRLSPSDNEDPTQDMSSQLQQAMVKLLQDSAAAPKVEALSVRPWIVLFLGVNGVGKTTTIGKLAAQYKATGKKVLLVAGDTFRAAAVEQLEAWGRRAGVELIKHRAGSDPSAVVYDGMQAARSRGVDVLLIDTAGRLHTKVHLVEELKKIRRVIAREQPGAPHETLLVLDATTGQNGLQQAKVFKEATDIDGIVLTKLDGTAKGGVIISIQEELGVPVRYIGVGEDIEDLQSFEAKRFVEALFER
ncbi:MAG TPA: signal recognition particle-docking protein FtsY [Candidatus Binatia bacterium]|nr:signal recognition particle-docking protein FtsY [Candidatus Binatia bacterium]HET9296042.1 signal recognition particle-docking protein FtsY [Candidatus Binatia bacterium]